MRIKGTHRCWKWVLCSLVVVADALMVLALVLPRVVGYAPVARFKSAQVQIEANFVQALDEFRVATGHYPTTAQGLAALTVIPPGSPRDRTRPMMQKLCRDPWGRKYRYLCPGLHNQDSYDLWSCGPDGRDGTADDVTNWEEQPATDSGTSSIQ